MTRGIIIAVALYVCICVLVRACGAKAEMIEPTFARAYNSWVGMNTRSTDGTISAPEFAAWQNVKREWRQLEKQMDQHYRGEK